MPGGDDDLDGVLNPVAGVAERGRQVCERERMGVNFRRIEALFRHQRHRAACGAAALAANPVDVNIILHQMSQICGDGVVRKCRETDFPAATSIAT